MYNSLNYQLICIVEWILNVIVHLRYCHWNRNRTTKRSRRASHHDGGPQEANQITIWCTGSRNLACRRKKHFRCSYQFARVVYSSSEIHPRLLVGREERSNVGFGPEERRLLLPNLGYSLLNPTAPNKKHRKYRNSSARGFTTTVASVYPHHDDSPIERGEVRIWSCQNASHPDSMDPITGECAKVLRSYLGLASSVGRREDLANPSTEE